MMKRLLILGLMLLLIGPLHADSNQDTATELAQTIVPVHDRIELARRLLGVTEIAPPPTSSPTWHLGDEQTFWVTNEYEDREYQVEASLRSIGDHIYFWVQSDVNIDSQVLDQLASIFDRKIYDPLHALWGSEASPGIDGDPRIYGLFAFGQGPGIAAYFSNVNTFPVEAVKSSNEHEMFFFNLDTLGIAFAPEDVAGTVAHEFQHMIQDNLDGNETSWLNEGFSVFTERYTGYLGNGLGSALTFLAVPGTQLNTWPEDVYSRRQHYGAGLMFVSYFYDRYGKDALHALANNTDPGLQSVDEVLQSLGEPDANHFFADWVLANFLQDPTLADGRYGYRSLPVLASPPPVASPQRLPYTLQSSANQYSTDYVVLNPAASVTSLDIRLNAPSTVSLVPTDAPSGKMMWYSNRADYSDTRLTQRFDLHEVEQATLNFKLWYSIENLWDYGYVMVSTDEGQTWTPLETPQMTTRESA